MNNVPDPTGALPDWGRRQHTIDPIAYGRLEAQVKMQSDRLDELERRQSERMDHMEDRIEQTLQAVQAIHRRMDQQTGGYKAIVAVCSVLLSIGGVVGWFVHEYLAMQRGH